jgi:tRNA (guanosine-2'-O-)-methyltransferase
MRREHPEVAPLTPHAAGTPLPAPAADVVEALEPFATPERKARIEAVIAGRTRRVVPVLERLSDPHNTAAVLRSADAFGAHEVHVVETEARFVASTRVAKGSERWLDLVRHADTEACVDALHARGYRVLVAAMDGEVEPRALAGAGRVAVVFGNEHAGVSAAMRARADGSYRIPMRGFVESLNVSVAAAITLSAALADAPGDLDDADREALRARFLLQSIDHAEEIVREHLRRRTQGATT